METCAERLSLSDAVVKAVAVVSEIRKNGRDAPARKQSTDRFAKPLRDALKAQRLAVSALHAHRQQHGC